MPRGDSSFETGERRTKDGGGVGFLQSSLQLKHSQGQVHHTSSRADGDSTF
jgi:hypothetical protein